jgi:hypothetical protein
MSHRQRKASRATSLSKGYDIIERFSEDIDLTYDVRQIIPELERHRARRGPPPVKLSMG